MKRETKNIIYPENKKYKQIAISACTHDEEVNLILRYPGNNTETESYQHKALIIVMSLLGSAAVVMVTFR